MTKGEKNLGGFALLWLWLWLQFDLWLIMARGGWRGGGVQRIHVTSVRTGWMMNVRRAHTGHLINLWECSDCLFIDTKLILLSLLYTATTFLTCSLKSHLFSCLDDPRVKHTRVTKIFAQRCCKLACFVKWKCIILSFRLDQAAHAHGVCQRLVDPGCCDHVDVSCRLSGAGLRHDGWCRSTLLLLSVFWC